MTKTLLVSVIPAAWGTLSSLWFSEFACAVLLLVRFIRMCSSVLFESVSAVDRTCVCIWVTGNDRQGKS